MMLIVVIDVATDSLSVLHIALDRNYNLKKATRRVLTYFLDQR